MTPGGEREGPRGFYRPSRLVLKVADNFSQVNRGKTVKNDPLEALIARTHLNARPLATINQKFTNFV